MTKRQFLNDYAAFRAEIARDEETRLANLARRRAVNARGFAARAAAAKAALNETRK